MAITKTNIGGSNTALYAFLQTLVPDFFASVEYTDPEDNTTAILCKDSDGNTVLSMQQHYLSGTKVGGQSIGYADASNSVTQSGYGHLFTNAYRTKYGALFTGSGNQAGCSVIIAKTNNGNIGFYLGATNFTTNADASWSGNTGAWGDEVPITQMFSFMCSDQATGTANQTILCPIPTHCALGETSVLDGAYCIPWAQYRTEGVITINGVDYATNGYIALMDE